MPAGAFTGARHFEFDDAKLDSSNGSDEFKTLRMGQEFKPQCVYVNTSSNATENALGYAVISGILFGENDSFRATYFVDIRKPVGLAFRKIWSNGTTARGIKLISEV